MFKTSAIKNYKRAAKKRILDKSIEECAEIRPDERRLPYCEVVSEQVLSDQRYLSLSTEQQGQFWRLMMHVFAPDNGIVVRHTSVIAKRLGLDKQIWETLERVFLNAGLLIATADGDYLIQHEFREQYLQTLEANNAMRRS